MKITHCFYRKDLHEKKKTRIPTHLPRIYMEYKKVCITHFKNV